MKIVVLMLGRFGDLVLSTPMLRELATYSHSGKIDLICGAKNYQLLKNEPYVNKIYVLDKRPYHFLKFILMLLTDQYDWFIDPKDHRSSESKILSFIVRATKKIGYKENHGRFDEYVDRLDDYSGHEEKRSHHSAKIMNVMKFLQNDMIIEREGYLPSLTLGSKEEAKIKSFLFSRKINRYVVLNISASTEYRYPDNSFWIDLFERIQLNLPIIVIYAPSESAKAKSLLASFQTLKINSNLQWNAFDFGTAEFTEITALIAESQLLITPDTAVVHVAAAFDIPVFGLYSWYEYKTRAFYPLSSEKVILWAKEGDAGVKSITTDEAVEAWYKSDFGERFSNNRDNNNKKHYS